MISKLFSAVLIAAGLLLTGCNDASKTAAVPEKAAATPVSMDLIAAEAKGFTVGSTMSARTVYVFFDAQCPHCGELWYSAKPLKSQTRFVWIPVGLLNAASTAQGAALLAASDPVAAMDAHEASLMARSGGMTAGSATDAQKEVIRKNTELLNRFGFTSIPTIVGINAKTGAVVSHEGAMPTPTLAGLLGLQAPAQ